MCNVLLLFVNNSSCCNVLDDTTMVYFDDIITNSEELNTIKEAAKKAAAFDITVLLFGESGTGKELFSRAIHSESNRSQGPFVAINCAGMPDSLLESELFGHEKGAFTDAKQQHIGKFEQANGGTLFMDEINELSPMAQVKILRALEYREFERVGGSKTISVDCRIIAACNKDLMEEVRERRFREDLYYRLYGISLNLLPLRKRTDDISILLDYFIKEFNELYDKNVTGVSDVVLSFFLRHNWPGNIRELRSLIKSAVAMCERDRIFLEDLPVNFNMEKKYSDYGDNILSLKGVEKAHIRKILAHCHWNKVKSAEILEISRPTLDRKIKEYKLKKEA